jgi:CheY-like chemotaxis protein/anti-sigma regulatory factor (Ser/Thr protein kinase)
MTTILIVDDDAVDRELARRSLKTVDALEFIEADNGELGLQRVAEVRPDIVLTDMRMPRMDGLELVRHLREEYPAIPTILMTSQGSERLAVEALRAGAMSYVPKHNLEDLLAETVRGALEMVRSHESRLQLMRFMTRNDTEFDLENDTGLIGPIAAFFQENLRRVDFGDERTRNQVAVAIVEAVSNSMIHGNLEVSSKLRNDSNRVYYEMIERRRGEEPYASRRVSMAAHETTRRVEYTVRDEGPGFDPTKLPDPTDPENLLNLSGRGITLIRTFMDEVEFRDGGTTIVMKKAAE